MLVVDKQRSFIDDKVEMLEDAVVHQFDRVLKHRTCKT